MAEMKFEEALKKLEKVVTDLEGENLSLDNALKRFEEGIKLSRFCTKRLKEVESKIEILVKNKTGKAERQSFKLEEKQEEDGGNPLF